MPSTSAATAPDKPACAADRIVDAARVATHVAHEARLLKTVAADTLEEGVHAAKRTMKAVERRVEQFGDLKDEAVHRVKRQPLLAIGAAFVVGLTCGVVAGWIGSRRRVDSSI